MTECANKRKLTFSSIFVIYRQLEVGPVAQSTLIDDFSFQFEDGDTGAIKCHPGGFLLRLELEVNGG